MTDGKVTIQVVEQPSLLQVTEEKVTLLVNEEIVTLNIGTSGPQGLAHARASTSPGACWRLSGSRVSRSGVWLRGERHH